MTTLEFSCADGTPFVVQFEREEDADGEWTLDREHFRDPLTPLGQAIGGVLGRAEGERAYIEAGLVVPSMFQQRGPKANGFQYVRSGPPSPEEIARIAPGAVKLLERYGSALGIWHDYCLPRAKEACATIQHADDAVPIAELAGLQAYAMQLTMVPLLISFNDVQLLTAAIADVCGDEAGFLAYELTQGYPNETLRANEELWALGRMIRASGPLTRAIGAGDPKTAMDELRAAGAEPEFFARLDAFLDEFGLRCEAWDIATPTWSEQREAFWAQLRRISGDDVPSPSRAIAEAAARRDAIVADIDAKLADDEDQRARFHRRVQRLTSYVAVREERALWQLISEGVLRQALLRRGARLVERGIVDQAGDILYLLPEEIEQATEDLRPVVKQRRAEHERWKAVTPPPVIGRTVAQATPDAGTDTLSGVAGARGVATGPARVLLELADAGRVEPGDVLVCVMTAPPWTPLFGIVSAVVTEYGDIGSHAAITAREYGIPCVVGAKEATTTIADGVTVTVDGTAGTVSQQAL